LPRYSTIDAYHMTACTIDEAVRRLLAVGVDPSHIGGVDNFCWPSIQYDPQKNPDGKFKAAQLVRACWALRDTCLAYEIPLLSGKDSMYVDGHLPGRYGETHKISALETIQFSATGVVADITRCVTMDAKVAGDLVYVLGITRDELGGSEYYAHLGYTGLNVPRVRPSEFLPAYRALHRAISQEMVASVHGVYKGGLGVHLAMVAMGGSLGMKTALHRIPAEAIDRDDKLLFSESAGRFILSVDPAKRGRFEELFDGMPLQQIGAITDDGVMTIEGLDRQTLLCEPVADLKASWQGTFGDLI
jgi:phosphoribosylformylglycinamidine synthase